LWRHYGQHGIGGRLWSMGQTPVRIQITGPAGQRIGSMGFANTHIEILGPCSDDVGWLNAGATIVVHGNAANGVANAMAQGRIYVAGNIGARGMTMTKHNPRFDPPELWVLGSAGRLFRRIHGRRHRRDLRPQAPEPPNVLGYRPLVGMVGGKVFFRGPIGASARPTPNPYPSTMRTGSGCPTGSKHYLRHIGQDTHLLPLLSQQRGVAVPAGAHTPGAYPRPKRAMTDFHKQVWEQELGKGGLVGDLTDPGPQRDPPDHPGRPAPLRTGVGE
jgi:hypothetical protein